MSALFLGVDVGTGSARAGLFTADGKLVGRGESAVRTWRPHADHVEQSSDQIWNAVSAAVAQAMALAHARPAMVAGIGFDATCSLAALDGAGRPVSVSVDGSDECNVIVWMDHRAIEDAAQINSIGHEVLAFVGGAISPEMQTPKLRWVHRELPQTWQRTKLWFDLPDFLTWRATGSTARSLCSTVCKWTYLGHERRWDPTYFNAIGLPDLVRDGFARIGQEVRRPGERIGLLTGTAARELGLEMGTPVAASLIDAHAGALGTLAAGTAALNARQPMALVAGTSACHLVETHDKVSIAGVWGPYFEALTPDAWLLEGGISASGAFIEHALRSHPATRKTSNVFELAEESLEGLLAKGASLESLGATLHMQPNVLGNRSPLADARLRGGIAGWALRDDKDDLACWYVACLQAVAYATRHIVEAFRDAGCAVDLLIASGGSAASARWRQIHADVIGLPVATSAEADGVLLGAAMLGAAAAHAYHDVREAMRNMTRLGEVVMPNGSTREFHDRKYRVYRRMIHDQKEYDAQMHSVCR